MKQIKLFFSILMMGLFFSCSKSVYVNSWQSKNVKADGNLQEWIVPLNNYDVKSKLQYSITNDSLNLYVCIRATDDQSQLKIIRAGMQVWIDTAGKNNQQVGILFPLSSSEHSANISRKPEYTGDSSKTRQYQKPDSKSLKARFNREPKEMKLVGFKPPIGGITLLQNENGIAANIDWDSTGIMNYEAIIPFKTFYKKSLSLSDSTKIFGINIIIPALPESSNSGGGGHEGASGFGGGGHGGGYGGGHGGGSHNSGNGYGGTGGNATMFEANKIITRIKLATKSK